VRFDLTKCPTKDKSGKKPRMNLKQIATGQIKGNWSEPTVEVLLVNLVASKKQSVE